MSEGKRPDVSLLSGSFYEESTRELARYCLALEAALVAMYLAAAGDPIAEHDPSTADITGCETCKAMALAAPLVSQIPAPQKESR